MGPAAAVRDLCDLVVSGVSVCHQASCKALQEALRTLAAPVGLVLKDPDMLLTVLFGGRRRETDFPHPDDRRTAV